MAVHLSRVVNILAIGSFALSLMAPPHALGQGLPDPTRPPPSLVTGEEPSSATTTGPVLQSVLISPTRRVAIINGKTVKLGEKFGEARLVKIAEGEVVLRGGQDVQVLKLFPKVEKRLAIDPTGTKADNR